MHQSLALSPLSGVGWGVLTMADGFSGVTFNGGSSLRGEAVDLIGAKVAALLEDAPLFIAQRGRTSRRPALKSFRFARGEFLNLP